MEPASFRRRYFALILDVTLLEILGTVITLPLVTRSGINPLNLFFNGFTGRFATERMVWLGGYVSLLVFLYFLYFLMFPLVCGQTPGKKLLGLRVETQEGNLPDLIILLGRLIAGTVLFILTLGLSYTWAALDSRKQALHDKLLGTQVVRLSP